MKFFFSVYDCYGMGRNIYGNTYGREGLVFWGVLHLFHVIYFFSVWIRIGNRRAIIESNDGWRQDTRRTHGGVGMFFHCRLSQEGAVVTARSSAFWCLLGILFS